MENINQDEPVAVLLTDGPVTEILEVLAGRWLAIADREGDKIRIELYNK